LTGNFKADELRRSGLSDLWGADRIHAGDTCTEATCGPGDDASRPGGGPIEV
jgi:hypothetical protein